jgi:hypothetical protein
MVYRAGGLMTSQTGKARAEWRRAVVGGVLAVGLMSGFGVSTALAQPDSGSSDSASGTRAPGENCTGDDCKKPVAGEAQAADGESQPTMTADQALMIIHNEYNLGDGGGQLSVLIDDVMKMRAQGFKPSNANKLAIQDALDHRPNQTPLVEALKSTLAYQRKLQAQQQMNTRQQGPVAGPVPVIPPLNGGTPHNQMPQNQAPQNQAPSINIPLG